jgi:hypothetical protein
MLDRHEKVIALAQAGFDFYLKTANATLKDTEEETEIACKEFFNGMSVDELALQADNIYNLVEVCSLLDAMLRLNLVIKLQQEKENKPNGNPMESDI